MSGFATLNGVNKELGAGWATVNGVWRKLGKGFVTQNGVWKACYSSGIALSDLPTGSLVSLNVNNVATNFIVVHHGLPSTDYDSSCNGTWLLMQDCADADADGNTDSVQFSSTSNNNSYKVSALHSYLNSDFLNSLESSIQSLIKTVKIPYVNGKGGSTVASGADGLETKIFALSSYEVGLASDITGNAQQLGSVLSYFDGADNTKRLAYYTYNAYTGKAAWWLRTPSGDSDSPNQSLVINSTGGLGLSGVTVTRYARPAMIMPLNLIVNPTPNADGSYTLLV